MRILADENIPGKAVQGLREGSHDALWIRENSPGINDPEIMRIAVDEQRIIVTFDKDFGELAVIGQVQNPPAIILLRISKPSPATTAETINQILNSREDWLGHLTVIDDTHIRMRPLENWKPSEPIQRTKRAQPAHSSPCQSRLPASPISTTPRKRRVPTNPAMNLVRSMRDRNPPEEKMRWNLARPTRHSNSSDELPRIANPCPHPPPHALKHQSMRQTTNDHPEC
jgi:predicted nuclease of predicted toxin-antitoxin system